MAVLTNVLYWVSTGLMIPVVVFLLIFFLRGLLMLGSFYAMYMNRLKFNRGMELVLEDARIYDVREIEFFSNIGKSGAFAGHLEKIVSLNWHPVHSEKILSDFELHGEKELQGAKSLMRIGPMLGLMGTLIPMGPALVGLSSGDIASMAQNMQVAFSTTVVGIFVGAIGFLLQLIRQRWLAEDINTLEYLYELSREGTGDCGCCDEADVYADILEVRD